jgi:hypothetical protein
MGLLACAPAWHPSTLCGTHLDFKDRGKAFPSFADPEVLGRKLAQPFRAGSLDRHRRPAAAPTDCRALRAGNFVAAAEQGITFGHAAHQMREASTECN